MPRYYVGGGRWMLPLDEFMSEVIKQCPEVKSYEAKEISWIDPDTHILHTMGSVMVVFERGSLKIPFLEHLPSALPEKTIADMVQMIRGYLATRR